MSAKYSNLEGIPISMAVWLAEDTYDHNSDTKTISATALMKPVKQICMLNRIPAGDGVTDISSLVASKMGSSIHESIENAWLNNYTQSLKDLGYPPGLIKSIVINPKLEDLTEDTLPIYMELRSSKVVNDVTVSGKFDFVGDGRLEDFKSTGVFAFMSGSNDSKYILQGSIYRWLNPEIITNDYMAIQFIFTDWKKVESMSNPKYPKTRLKEHVLPLKSIEETDAYIKNKLSLIDKCMDLPEEEMPMCTDEDLWRTDPVWKYYKSGKISPRSTKNFPSMSEANNHRVNDGSVGIVVEVKGQVKACNYCNVASICQQRLTYIADKSLKI